MPLRVRLARLLEYAEEAGYRVENSDGHILLRFSPPPSPSWMGGAVIEVEFTVDGGYAILAGAWLETADGRTRIDEELLTPWLICVDPGVEDSHKEY